MTDIEPAYQEFTDTESGYRVVSATSRPNAEEMLGAVLAKRIEFEALYKDTAKCLVGRFKHPELGDLVLKVPRARSERRWERFLTLFRSGEGPRQFKNMQKLLSLGLNGPVPIVAAEKREKGVVVDSFYIYSFIEGRDGELKDLGLIIEVLLPLYQQGYRRADPKVENHILAAGNDVYLIDFRVDKPKLFGRLRCAMEFCQLAQSQRLAREFGVRAGFSRSLITAAWSFQRASQRLRKVKQRLRKAVRGRAEL